MCERVDVPAGGIDERFYRLFDQFADARREDAKGNTPHHAQERGELSKTQRV